MLRPEGPVFRRVPLGRDLGEAAFQIVLLGHDHLPRAHRAPRPPDPGGHRRPPAVPPLAAPPDLFRGPGGELRRPQGPVLFQIPLVGQVRMGRCQVVLPGQDQAVGAVGAPGPAAPALDHGFPMVPLFTGPPDPPLTAVPDRFGR